MARAVWAARVKRVASLWGSPANSSAIGSDAEDELPALSAGRAGGRVAEGCTGGAVSSVLAGFWGGGGAGADVAEGTFGAA